MRSISVDNLQANLEEILPQLQESGEILAVVEDGRVLAYLQPVRRFSSAATTSAATTWADIDRLAAEIAPYLTEGVSAVEAVRDVRRDL